LNVSTPGAVGDQQQETRQGLLAGLGAYLLWGILPVYFVFVRDVASLEVLAHRIVWSIPFGALIIFARRQWREVAQAFLHRGMLLYLTLSAALIAGNWVVYIWAVQREQIFQASLGYYINPLLFAVAGVVLLGERLRRARMAAVSIAATGVAVLTVSGGRFPAIALFLGVSFTLYGIIRKKVVIGGMPGLFVETAVLLPFAGAYLVWQALQGTLAFGDGIGISAYLALAGPFTVVPLLLFALAARRLDLSMVGMMQFIAPTLQFLIGYYLGEPLTTAHLVCFACIWTAVLIFSWDVWRQAREGH